VDNVQPPTTTTSTCDGTARSVATPANKHKRTCVASAQPTHLQNTAVKATPVTLLPPSGTIQIRHRPAPNATRLMVASRNRFRPTHACRSQYRGNSPALHPRRTNLSVPTAVAKVNPTPKHANPRRTHTNRRSQEQPSIGRRQIRRMLHYAMWPQPTTLTTLSWNVRGMTRVAE
jgi:hypothetical protein